MGNYAFGIDIGGTTVKMGLFDNKGALLDKWEIPTRTEEDGAEILPDVAASLLTKLTEREASVEGVVGIGVGAPGAVTGSTTVNRCANLGWGVVNVAEQLKELTGVSAVRVGNDANVAALGEMWKGGGRGYRNMVMVTLGTGVGGGIIVDGEILEGAFGAGGEIGHMTVFDEERELCGCGGRGHLEQYASATGIVRLARRTVLREREELTAKDVIDAAKAGEPAGETALTKAVDMLGKALASIACVVDPEAFVIGGGVSKAGTFLLDRIRESYREYAFHASKDTAFALAQLGNDAGIYGAVKMVLEDGQ